MLTPLLPVLSAQQAIKPPTAGVLISRMLKRYYDAKTLQGTVRTTQSAQNVSVTTITSIAYERPSKILVDQKQGGSRPRSALLVSDGKQFMYSWPDQILTGTRMMRDNVASPGAEAQTVGQLYTVVAANLPDRSPVLDLLVARREDMAYVSAQFASFSLEGKAQIGGREVNVIKGDWRENGANTSVIKGAVGRFELDLADDGDLVRYVLRQNFGVPSPVRGGASAQTVEVTSTWDASIKVDAPVEPTMFVLRAR